jgi:biopolymer transport protein TolQ
MTLAADASMLNPIALFLEADIVVKAIMIGLAVASLWSWAVIIDKAMRFASLNSQANSFEDAVGSGRSLEDIAAQAGPNPTHPLPRMLIIALADWREARTRGPLTENQANLLMSRGAARFREVAVRSALGAGRARLVAQFLTESLVLAGMGAIAGLVLAIPAMRLMETLVPETMAAVRLTLDWRVLAFSTAAALAATLTFGLAPALRGSRTVPQDGLKEGGRGTTGARNHWFQHSLIVVETALAVALLTSAGLLLQGQPIVGVVHDAGYFDQPHLTRSLTSLIGRTPGDIARRTRQLAYLHPTHL